MPKKEKTSGFVYIWYDRKHKRFYIGSHWGEQNDGYVCSSNWMKRAYKLRPTDFRKEILAIVDTNHADLLAEEQRWLNMIKPHELRKRYYNLKVFAGNHWAAVDPDNRPIREKISEKVRAKWQDPEFRERTIRNSREGRIKYWQSEAGIIEREKRSQAAKLTGKRPPELTPEWRAKQLEASAAYRISPEFKKAMANRQYSEETKQAMGASMRGKNHKEETKEAIRIGNSVTKQKKRLEWAAKYPDCREICIQANFKVGRVAKILGITRTQVEMLFEYYNFDVPNIGRKAKVRDKIACSCGKLVDKSNYARWHGDCH